MRRPRVRLTVGWLMAAVAFVAVGTAALRAASARWEQAVFTLTLGVLLTSILGAVYSRGLRRTFWLGFALFGWAYWVLIFGPWFNTFTSPHLASSRLIFDLCNLVHPPPVFQGTIGFGTTEDFISRASFKTQENFRRIAHSLTALLSALLGGLIALRFAATAARTESR
jgi:hypothetical protein